MCKSAPSNEPLRADTYRPSFCLGDAVHPHPPGNGLGSNTCIQDAYNLAWKVAYVSQGLASPSLLETYTIERQPIGAAVVKRANDVFKDNAAIMASLGLMTASLQDRKEHLASFSIATQTGAANRAAFHAAIQGMEYERGGLGAEMNQRYDSPAIYLDDEPEAYPSFDQDPILHHQRSTYPGSRLPHVWLNKTIPTRKPISTHDLAGHGVFTIFTGIGGAVWKEAASVVSKHFGVTINTYSIGWRQDWSDAYLEWAEIRGIEESGCLLIRPDRTVAWRAKEALGDAEAVEKLKIVIGKILAKAIS